MTPNVSPVYVNDLEDVVRQEMSVCLWVSEYFSDDHIIIPLKRYTSSHFLVNYFLKGTTFHDIFFSLRHPEYSHKAEKVFRYESYEDVFQGVMNNTCEVALMGRQAYNAFQRDSIQNEECGLGAVGRTLQNSLASFATKMDVGDNCTSLISSVLDLHMNEMDDDGFIGRLWNQTYSNIGSNRCDTSLMMQGVLTREPKPLQMRDMYGIFLFHSLLSGSSVLLALVITWWKRFRGNHDAIGDHPEVKATDGDDRPSGERASIWASDLRRENTISHSNTRSQEGHETPQTLMLRRRRPYSGSMPPARSIDPLEGFRRHSVASNRSSSRSVSWGVSSNSGYY